MFLHKTCILTPLWNSFAKTVQIRDHGFTGGFLLLWIFSAAISVSPHVCFILDLILIYMFLR